MGLPLLKDVPTGETISPPQVSSLDRLEEIVRDGEMRSADLAQRLDEFVLANQALLAELSEEDAVEAFEQIESLRDAVLVREAQELSAHAFWTDDDE